MWNNIENMILYEDKEIIVCHKAAGIAVQSARWVTRNMGKHSEIIWHQNRCEPCISGDRSSSGSAGGKG